MKLYINEKVFSLHDKFYVYDEQGNSVFELTSKIISLGDKTTVLDMQGNEVAYIEQELLHFMPVYNVYMGGEFICKISRKFGFLSKNYELSNGFKVEGNCFPLDVNIYNAKNDFIGTIKKSYFTVGDKYEIEIFDDCYLKIVLAIVVAIAKDVNRSQSRSS